MNKRNAHNQFKMTEYIVTNNNTMQTQQATYNTQKPHRTKCKETPKIDTKTLKNLYLQNFLNPAFFALTLGAFLPSAWRFGECKSPRSPNPARIHVVKQWRTPARRRRRRRISFQTVLGENRKKAKRSDGANKGKHTTQRLDVLTIFVSLPKAVSWGHFRYFRTHERHNHHQG